MAKKKLNKLKKATGLQPIDHGKAFKYKSLTPEMVEEIMKERDFVPEIKKLQNYEDLYYLEMEDGGIVANSKFLEEFDKAMRDSIEKL